jgi:hypothetical protein
VGWLVVTGPTLEAVILEMKEKEKLLPEGMSASTESLYELLKKIQDGEKEGIDFGEDKIPDPIEVMEATI